MYMPPVGVVPAQGSDPKTDIPVLEQGKANACTGFALSSVVFYLLRAATRKPSECRVSPYMLYSMARRYDELAGNTEIGDCECQI